MVDFSSSFSKCSKNGHIISDQICMFIIDDILFYLVIKITDFKAKLRFKSFIKKPSLKVHWDGCKFILNYLNQIHY